MNIEKYIENWSDPVTLYKEELKEIVTLVAQEAYDRGAMEATTVANGVIEKARREALEEVKQSILEIVDGPYASAIYGWTPLDYLTHIDTLFNKK